MSDQTRNKTVLVTGFGPFGQHTVNASWVAVQELAKKTMPNINIVIKEIPVVYDTVKQHVPQLWQDVKPDVKTLLIQDDYQSGTYYFDKDGNTFNSRLPPVRNIQFDKHLVIHVGVSKEADALTLEQQAHNDGYKRLDVLEKCPSNNYCVEGANDCLVSGINMEKICSEVNESGIKAKAVVSHDPGRYLCDFSYFLSLNIDSTKSAFVHVPPLDTPYTSQELAEGLEQVIISMLKQRS